MRRICRVAVALGLIGASGSLAFAETISISNAGFELPSVPGFQYNPTLASQGGTGWTFASGSGVTSNGSFNMTGATDDQAGLIQGAGAAASFSQSLFFGGGSYQLSFLGEGRTDQFNGYGSNPFQVFIDAAQLLFGGNGTLTPVAGGGFEAFLSDSFTVLAGNHTLAFKGLGVDGQDVTSFIDQVAIAGDATVPEPTSLLLLGSGLLAIGARVRRHVR